MLTRTRKAFTLLELIVVIVILGILALLAIPTFQKVIDKTKAANTKRAAESIDRELRALAAFDQVTTISGPTGVESYVAKMTDTTNGATTDLPSGVVIADTLADAQKVVAGASAPVAWSAAANATTGAAAANLDGTFYVVKDGFGIKVQLVAGAPATFSGTATAGDNNAVKVANLA